MTAFAKLLAVQTKRTMREPATVFFVIAFGPIFAIFMGVIFGNDPSPEYNGRGYLDVNLVGFSAIVVAIVSLIVVPVDVVTERDSGALRRFRATPLPPLAYITADVLVRFVSTTASITAMILIAMLIFDLRPEGNVLFVILGAALGVLAFLAIGYVLAAIFPSTGIAQAIGNVLVFPLIFLSGGAVPFEVMPDNARQIADYSPLTQLTKLLHGLWQGETWSDNWVALIVLVGVLVVATALAARLFRWE